MTESEITTRQKELREKLEALQNSHDHSTLPQRKSDLDILTQVLVYHADQKAIKDHIAEQRKLITLYKEFTLSPLTVSQQTFFQVSFDQENEDHATKNQASTVNSTF